MENNETYENRIDLSELKEGIEAIKAEMGKVLVGQSKMIDLMVVALLTEGHILIEGVPGVAKTLTSRLFAKLIESDFQRIQFTPDLMPSDILGTSVFNMKTSDFQFKKGPLFSNIVLIDEINRSPAKTQSALFEVMEENQITVDGNTYKMASPYMVLATQNPVEQEGTYRLPEAQLDRFMFKIHVKYPTLEEETEVLTRHHSGTLSHNLDAVKPILNSEKIEKFKSLIHQVQVDDNLLKFISSIVHETRVDASLYLGGSPRASLAILNGAKGLAAMRGRDFVTPEDITAVTFPSLRHRIILTPDREMEGVTADHVIKEIIRRIEVPR